MQINLNTQRSFVLWFQRSDPCQSALDRPAESFASCCWTFKIRTILNPWEKPKPSSQFNPITILIHREPYRTLSNKYAISIELIPYSNFNLIANLMKMMNLWWMKPLIQIFTQFESQSVFWTFSLVSSLLQWHTTLLFKERIELSKFGQNLTYVYRYKWWFVSIQTLWPAFKLKDLTYVSIQTRMCIDTYISFLKSWLICIKSCKHDSIHHALSDFLREVSVYRYMQAWFDTQVTLCLWEITFVSIQVIYVSIQIAQNQSEVISGHLYRYTCLCIDT
jgi:hypothetical protein